MSTKNFDTKTFVTGFVVGFILAVINVAVVMYIFINQTNLKDISLQSKNYFFATTHDGREIMMHPQDRPNMSRVALMNWVSETLATSFKFGFNDYEQRLSKIRGNFTLSGWESFNRVLKEEKLIERMQKNNSIISSVITETPSLQQEAVIDEKYTWRFHAKLLITIFEASDRYTRSIDVIVDIKRVDISDNTHGIQISNLKFK